MNDKPIQPVQDGVSFCENCNQLTQWVDNVCQRCRPDGYGFGAKGLLTKEEARTGIINRIMSTHTPTPEWYYCWSYGPGLQHTIRNDSAQFHLIIGGPLFHSDKQKDFGESISKTLNNYDRLKEELAQAKKENDRLKALIQVERLGKGESKSSGIPLAESRPVAHLNYIPDWVTEYDKKNWQSSAGKAVRVLIKYLASLTESHRRLYSALNSLLIYSGIPQKSDALEALTHAQTFLKP